MISPCRRPTSPSKLGPGVCAGIWCIAVAAALALTLRSLRHDAFDGLNNLFQIPFALPWFLLPLPALLGDSHQTDAWLTATMGWFNGWLLFVALARRSRRPDPPAET